MRILVKIFLPHEMDINGHFCLKNDCLGWLVKIQDPFFRHVKISWVAGVDPPGVSKFSCFHGKYASFNISFDIIETDTMKFYKEKCQKKRDSGNLSKNRCTRRSRAYYRTNLNPRSN